VILTIGSILSLNFEITCIIFLFYHSLSLSLTHTHTHYISLSLSHTHTHIIYVYINLFILFTMLLISYKVFDWLRMIKMIPLFPVTLIAGMSV